MNKRELKVLMLQKEITYEDIAKVLGCTSRNVYDKVKKENFTVAEIKKLMSAFDFDTETMCRIFYED